MKLSINVLKAIASSASTTQASANRLNGEKDLYSVPPLFLEYTFRGSHIFDKSNNADMSWLCKRSILFIGELL